MNFGQALDDMKRGKCAERPSWVARNLYIGLVGSIKGNKLLTPIFVMKEAHHKSGKRWMPSMLDLLADDWKTFALVEDEEQGPDQGA